MTDYLVFGRHAYDRPLRLVGVVSSDTTPTTEQVGLGSDWLELVVVPEEEVIWVLRDADLVRPRMP